MKIKRVIAAALSITLLAEAFGPGAYEALALDAKINPIRSGGAVALHMSAITSLAGPVANLSGGAHLPGAASGVGQSAAFIPAAASDLPVGGENPEPVVFENAGPNGKGTLTIHNPGAQVYRMTYDGGYKAVAPNFAVKPGEKPVFVLVGTGEAYDRGWVTQWVADALKDIGAKEKGLEDIQLVIVDEAAHRPKGAEHYIVADIADSTPKGVAAVKQAVVDYFIGTNLRPVAAATMNQAYVRLAPAVQSALRDAHNPNLRVNSQLAIDASVAKFDARNIINRAVKEQYLAAEAVGNAEDADIETRVREAFRKVSAETPTKKVVLKINKGAGKGGQRLDISTEAEMITALHEIQRDIALYKADPAKLALYLQQTAEEPVPLIVEGMIDLKTEIDDEFTISQLPDGRLDIMGFIIGNANPGSREKGYLFGVDGLMSKEFQHAFIRSGLAALIAVYENFDGVPFGPFHIEVGARGNLEKPDTVTIEINPTRPVGGNGIRFAMEWCPEVNLVANAVRATLGLPLVHPMVQPKGSFMLLGMEPQRSGIVRSLTFDSNVVDKVAWAGYGKGISRDAAKPMFAPLADVGDTVAGSEDKQPGAVGAISVRGTDAIDAIQRIYPGLQSVNATVETSPGVTYDHNGAHEHSPADWVKLPQAAGSLPLLSTKAGHILGAYAKAQERWAPTFAIYYPMFSALMNAMAGLAGIGVGRLGYTIALFVSSPLASVLASRYSVRDILLWTWGARIGLWALAMPLTVLLLAGNPVVLFSVVGIKVGWLLASVFALNFVDGALVSLSHSVDMDTGGIDETAKQHGFHKKEITPEVKKVVSGKYFAWQSKANFIFPISIGLAVIAATSLALPVQWALLAGMGLVFGVQGTRAVMSVLQIPKLAAVERTGKGIMSDFIEGVKIVYKDKKVRGLVAMEAVERVFGDGLRLVTFPLVAMLTIAPALKLNNAWAVFFTSVLSAAMSYAGMVMANYVRKHWKTPEKGAAEHPAFKPLYPMMFVAGLTTLSFPAAHFMIGAGYSLTGTALAILGSMLFMVGYRPAMMGAMNMFTTAAAKHERSQRIYGLSSSFQMLVAGLGVLFLERIFSFLPLGPAYLAMSAFYMTIGVFYWVIWPRLASRVADAKK